MCAFCLVMFLLLPQTSAANILYRRAKRLRKETGDDRLRSQSEIDAAHHTARDRLMVLGRAFILLFTEPIVFVMDTFIALVYGMLFIWFESFPLVFGGIYGFDLGAQGLVYLGIFTGLVITVPLYLLWVKHGIIPAFTKPTFKPEMVLPPTFVGSLALSNLPILVRLVGSGECALDCAHHRLGFLHRRRHHRVQCGIQLSRHRIPSLLGIRICRQHPLPRIVRCGIPAFCKFAQSPRISLLTFAELTKPQARALFTNLGVGPGNSLLGAIATLFVPISFIVYKVSLKELGTSIQETDVNQCGDRIRQKSKNARHDL